MPDALNFYQFQFVDDLINNPIVAKSNPIGMLRPAQLSTPWGNGFSARFSTASMISSSVLAGNLRRSLRVDFFHSMRKGTALQPFLELGVRNGPFPAPFGNDGQIVHVFQQLFIIANVQNNGGFPPLFVRQKLNNATHV